MAKNKLNYLHLNTSINMDACFAQALDRDLLWNYLDFLLEVMVIGVPRKASERAREEGLGL